MHCRRPLLIAVILAAALFGSLNLNHLHAQGNEEPLVIEAGDYRLQINDLWLAGVADGKKPSHGMYLVMDITLFNDSSSAMCFHDRYFTAKLSGLEDQTPEDLSEVRDEFFEGRDYPGGFLGQCVDAGESVLSLLEYDVPGDIETITLRFTPKDEEVETTLVLPRRAARLGDGVIGLRLRVSEPVAEEREEPQTARQLASPTSAPSPSSLPSPTPTQKVIAEPRVASTLQATPTPRVTSTPRPTATSAVETRYISATSNVNVRSCASTACEVVMVLAAGSAINALGSQDGWYEITLVDGRTGYVADFLTSASRSTAPAQPSAPRQPVQPPIQADINAAPPAQQDTALEQPAAPPAPAPEQPISTPPPAASAFVCDCSKTCPMMASCEEAYFQLNQCGCGPRDGDSDGMPCEDICPGG